MDKKIVVQELEKEVKVLEEQLGNVRLALRGFKGAEEGAVATKQRSRVHITPDLRERYNEEIKAVLEAFGSCTVKEISQRGNFESLSDTSIYRLLLAHDNVSKSERGRTLVFALNP